MKNRLRIKLPVKANFVDFAAISEVWSIESPSSVSIYLGNSFVNSKLGQTIFPLMSLNKV